MNEEFGVLKDMIPACQGQDMHKLAILQASIDYLRYLEQCVTGLKAVNGTFAASISNQPQVPAPRPSSPTNGDEDEDDEDEEEKEDLEMEDYPSATASPAIAPTKSGNVTYSNTPSTVTSPAMLATPTQKDHSTSYPSTTSSLPSPAFPPQSYQHNYQNAAQTLHRGECSLSTGTSPTIFPEGLRDADQEATAALLMLNTDRRNPGGGRSGGRGMSVRDLLSA